MGTVALYRDYSTAYGTANPFPQILIDELDAPAFPHWLERLTGIAGLVTDPSLFGGGVHQIALHYYAAEPAPSRFGRSKLTNCRERLGERFGGLKHKVHQARIRLGGAWRR